MVRGLSEDTFGPGEPVTRQQLVTFLYRYAQRTEAGLLTTTDLSPFPDAGQVSDWAVEAVTWAVGEELIRGTDTGFEPDMHATRAQFTTMIERYATGD